MADAPAHTEPPPPPTITVDGRPIEARPGEMVIAAAERNGIFIPRFCYHPRMKPVGMCRMCLVEIKGPRGFSLQPSCFVPVADGQEVVTTSPAVRKAQDGVLEFLLINHPLDCPVCDRGGECPLQDQTLAFGPGESRFVEEKRHWAKPIALSPLVALDRERCIQCARCTRFAEEVAGDPLIDFVGRSDQTEVNTFPDDPFGSYFSGNTVQICPVGALTAYPYRFRARPWDLEAVESTCTTCSVGCRVTTQSSSDRVIRYLGVDSDPVNHGWLCDKGRFDHEYLVSPDRLTAPVVRQGGRAGSGSGPADSPAENAEGSLVEASWNTALAAAGDALRQAARVPTGGSVAFLGGARLTNEDAYAWTKLAKGVVGTDNVDCQLGDGLPAEVILGLRRATIDQACSAAAVVLLAPDLKEELPVLYLRLREAAIEAKVPVIELSAVRTALSRHCAASLRHRPGEAAAVAQALVGQASSGDQHGSGNGVTRPARGAEVGGVSGADLDKARSVLAEAGAAGGDIVLVLGRPSVAETAGGVVDAAGVLAAGIEGLRVLPALRRGNVHGALDMGMAPGVLPGRTTLDAGRDWFSARWDTVPSERGMDAAAILAASAAGEVSVLVLVGCDPLSDFPDRALARRGLDGAGFIVAVDTFLNESSRRADVVLAATAYAERAGTTTNLEGRVTRVSQKVSPPGLARADWIIAGQLASELGADLGFESLEGLWAEIEALAPSHRGISSALLARPEHRDGVVAPLGTPLSPDENSEGRPPILEWQGSGSLTAPPPLDGYSWRMVSGRTLYDSGTMVSRCPSMAPLAQPGRLAANPFDLDRLGVGNGGSVRVRSARTALVMEVESDPDMPRGVVAVPFNHPGAAAAELIDSDQPVTDVRLETL